MTDSSDSPSNSAERRALAEGILTDDDGAVERLFAQYRRGLTFYFSRQLGSQSANELVVQTLMLVWEAIRAGSVREPERLTGFVLTIARRIGHQVVKERMQIRQMKTRIDHQHPLLNSLQTAPASPEESLFKYQQQAVMLYVLRSMSQRDREVLYRFYQRDESPERIQAEMRMTETHFRLTKSRAKARFGQLGRRIMIPPSMRLSVQMATLPTRGYDCTSNGLDRKTAGD